MPVMIGHSLRLRTLRAGPQWQHFYTPQRETLAYQALKVETLDSGKGVGLAVLKTTPCYSLYKHNKYKSRITVVPNKP
jgi:hypothetical protein